MLLPLLLPNACLGLLMLRHELYQHRLRETLLGLLLRILLILLIHGLLPLELVPLADALPLLKLLRISLLKLRIHGGAP